MRAAQRQLAAQQVGRDTCPALETGRASCGCAMRARADNDSNAARVRRCTPAADHARQQGPAVAMLPPALDQNPVLLGGAVRASED